MSDSELLQCYNRGCGQKYNPKNNIENSCCHHPGEPFFHDAYKGWSCCNKKCTDFTEFLNMKGCTLSSHSNIKPPVPEKPKAEIMDKTEVIVVKPITPSQLPRPPFDDPLILMKPEISPLLKQQVMSTQTTKEKKNSNEIEVGTICKHSGCKVTYGEPNMNDSKCIYHPGYPVFHEGLKFWSCCQKRTTDFQTFLDQIGCEEGTHLWKKEIGDKSRIDCRWDYHQTASHVIVAIYAKQYDVIESVIKMNPIRLYTNLVFPQEQATFLLDLELRGIVDVDKSKITMYGTKVEISLKKAEPGSWSTLEIPRNIPELDISSKKKQTEDQEISSGFEAVDLSGI